MKTGILLAGAVSIVFTACNYGALLADGAGKQLTPEVVNPARVPSRTIG